MERKFFFESPFNPYALNSVSRKDGIRIGALQKGNARGERRDASRTSMHLRRRRRWRRRREAACAAAELLLSPPPLAE